MDKTKRGKVRTLRVPTELQCMVKLIEPTVRRKRLSLAQETSLKSICDDYTPGRALICMFAGESGTDKTMAAQVLAKELDRDLLRVDLSAVVSKYIGETEKNLKRIFDAAEAGRWILFFDETDALFGKRTDVKDSHDRFANLAINYLLQRMESHPGPIILATNTKRHLDAALVRRLHYIIDFPDT